MDYLTRLTSTIERYIFAVILASNLALVAGWYLCLNVLNLSMLGTLVALIALSGLLATLITLPLSALLVQPLRAVWQLILHVSPSTHGIIAPNIESLKLGRELVTNLASQVYQLASVAEHAASGSVATSSAAPIQTTASNFVQNNLPLPLFVLDQQETIGFANQAAADYIGIPVTELIGKNVYMVLDMAFLSENTLDNWLKQVKNKSATASMSWERVRLNVLDNHPTRLFDLAAYYNKDNPSKQETMLVLFDHTKQYSQDEQAVSFIALSVHELRTPLTLLRGYIEAFEEELGEQLNPQMVDFMQKMSATAQQLTAFVNNILNVARIDDDQLELQLQEEEWGGIVLSAVDNITLRAKVRGITLETNVAPNLPKVGVDRLSIHEVINNIVDNAIKYSGTGKVIKVDAHVNSEGMVETTIQDQGMGIGANILPNLFTKFYRDHRNRAQVGGTGLGLYLSKAIVTAHGGNIWVKSKPGEGSTFGFTLQRYDELAEGMKNGHNSDIVRGAHGWIKNHSLYRR